MEYKTANLSSKEIEQLQLLENNLCNVTGDHIVLVAYTNEHDETGSIKARTESQIYPK